MNKDCVLITGASGFIGSHLLAKLVLDRSFSTLAIVRKTKGCKNVDELKKNGVIFVEGEFYDKDLIRRIFKDYPIQYVVHLAGLRGVGSGRRKDYDTVNVQGTEVLLEASHKQKIKKFIFSSSVGVFGTIPGELPASFNTELNGDNLYHCSKILAEKKVLQYIDKGLDAYIIRPTITYGHGAKGFPMILVELVKKRIFLLPIKDIKIHLLDVVRLVELLIKMINSDTLGQRIFIAADEAPISFEELVNLIHFQYYKKSYPSILIVPGFILQAFLRTFRLVRNEKWATRILLISKSWYYDISETINTFQYIPAKTEETFIKSMC